MCGIAGVVGGNPGRHVTALEAQLLVQQHRGPDAAGSFARGPGAIAQNRLAIIDVEHGDPPITTEDGAVAAVLNGEIYNFRELRSSLRGGGHVFKTECDTEVLAHLAEEVSAVEMASQLVGMFAFAVWDSIQERLVLGRDRFGKKPLYWWWSAGALVFASEIKGVLAHPDVPRRLDPDAIPAYLSFGYVPTPKTFFDGIHSLPPGHVLTLRHGGEPSLERYWAPPRRASRPGPSAPSLDEAAKAVRRLLDGAVRRRLVADVPIGAYLSGGIDSSAVVAAMARTSGQRIATFTIGFDDREGYDERPHARSVARRYATDHHEFVVQPDAVDLIEQLVWHHDQPFGDSSAIPTYLLSKLTREHVTVALCGDGGDELFAGYERFAAGLAVGSYLEIPAPLRAMAIRGLRVAARRRPGRRAGKLSRFAAAAEQGMPEAYLHWLSFIDEPTRQALLADGSAWARCAYADTWRSSDDLEPLDRLLDLNLRTYLLDDLLVKADRMSMAHGLEVRSPFLDADLADYAITLAPRLKLRGLSFKRVLKHAVRDDLPEAVIRRGKRGFGVPLDRWFREDLARHVAQTLGSRHAHIRRHVDGDAVDALIAEHRGGRRNRGGALWTLLTLEVFLGKEDW